MIAIRAKLARMAIIVAAILALALPIIDCSHGPIALRFGWNDKLDTHGNHIWIIPDQGTIGLIDNGPQALFLIILLGDRCQ